MKLDVIFLILSLILFYLSFIAIIIGLIKPGLVIRWGEKRTRLRAFLIYGLCTIIFLVLFMYFCYYGLEYA